jgi:tetratricopeptide (TPR) repeat protein
LAASLALLLASTMSCDDRPERPASENPLTKVRVTAAPATQPSPASRPVTPVVAKEPEGPKPPGYDAKRAETLKDGTVRRGATTLLLTTEEAQDITPRGPALTYQSLLVREIARQAVLIAGRDGLGLSTRDATLREPLEAAGEAAAAALPPLDLHWYVVADHEAWFALADNDPSQPRYGTPGPGTISGPPLTIKPWLEHSMTPRKTGYGRFAPVAELVQQAEALSRKELVAALERAGFAGKANTRDADGKLAKAIADRLDHLDLFSQFQVVRETHAEIRAKGESRARLAALARGYANLGQLAQFYWHGDHNALTARALLYAQRMVASAEQPSAVALWHRAYARALAGLHADALHDLAAAEKVQKAAGAKAPKPPGFVELLGPFCRYQAGTLSKLAQADPRRAPLAMYLCFLTVENADSASLPIEVGKAALEVEAGNARLIDSMCDRAGVAYLHGLTQLGPEAFSKVMLARLKPMADLPESVRDAGRNNWQSPATRAAVARAMVDAGAPGKDAGEPSWAMLGRQVQEVHFVQTYRRAYFMARQWSVDTRGYHGEVAPIIADHPYGPWITAVVHGVQNLGDKRLSEIPLVDYELHKGEMLDAVVKARYRAVPKFSGDVSLHLNPTAPHLENNLRRPNAKAVDAAVLREVSPRSPAAMAFLIEHAWDEHVEEAKAWEKESDDHPTVMAAFARRHTAAGNLAEAEGFLKRYVARSPDQWAYFMLADNYLREGKEDQWLKALEEFLTKEDYGLTHAEARLRIARHFMFKGDYARAEPYVLAANETGAGWAMLAAADLYEGMGKLDEAERWLRANSERYGGGVYEWHRWCLRSGRGNLAQAEQAARQLAMREAGNPASRTAVAVFHMVVGEPEVARKVLEGELQSATGLLHMAMLAQAEDDYARRDNAVQFVAMRALSPDPGTQRLVKVAAIMQDTWKEGPAAPLDLKKVEAAMVGAAPLEQTTINYFVGKFMDLQGSKADAIEYYTRCVKGERNAGTAMLAWHALQDHGIDPTTRIAPVPPQGAAN